MLKSYSTNEFYEECLNAGLCKDHLKELEVKDEAEGYELQRKAILFIRLQILGPLVFNKPFISEKMKTLIAKSKCFPDKNDKKKDYKEAIMVLDSVVVYTLCYFSKVCCAGVLYQPREVKNTQDPLKQRILDLLSKKILKESDISHFNPILKETFTGFDKNLIKISYVTALLCVRNATINMKLRDALDQLDRDLNNVSREGEKWKIIGNDSFKAKQYDEAINAFSSAINFNPYNVPLLKNRAQTYLMLKQYGSAVLDYYIVLVLDPTSIKYYYKLSYSLLQHNHHYESYLVAEYAIEKFKDCKEKYPKIYESVEKIKDVSEKNIERSFNTSGEISKDNETITSSEEEEADIPDLIEGSDSESDTQDIPDLMDASDSEESESEVVSEKKNEGNTSEDPVPETQKPVSCFKDEMAEKREDLSWSIKEASYSLIDGTSSIAISRYHAALNKLKTNPEIYNYDENQMMLIKYAYGCALCKSTAYDDLQKAINIFQEVKEEHNTHVFPAANYGIGLVCFKLNWFKDALVHLRQVKDVIEQGIPFQICSWPGLNAVIEETMPEHLKIIVEELIKECENPPPPDAVCRLDKCALHPSIYLTDPNFKGYYFAQCSEQCCLQYHPQCWKFLRSLKQCTDKAFLEQKCFTPDCVGVICKIQNICKEGNVDKTFSIAETKKLAKQKRTKVIKKSDIKDEKKRRRKDSTSKSESAEVTEEKPCDNLPVVEVGENSKKPKSHVKPEVNERNEDPSSSSQLSTNAEPFIMLKKEKLVDELPSKTSVKSKEHKKVKSNTVSIDEFLQQDQTNDFSRRLNVLREKNQSIIEGCWTNCNKSVYQVENAALTKPEVDCNPFEIKSSNSLLPNQSTASSYTENGPVEKKHSLFANTLFNPPGVMECVKKEVYSYLKDLLQKHGPLRIDDPILIDELKDFPSEANQVIADCNGIGGFLKCHMDFALVGETYVCVVADVVAAYEKLSTDSLRTNKLNAIPRYPVYSTGEDGCDETFNSSCLNPSAKEYLPPGSSHASIDSALSDENMNRNSPELISAISKLRQPLAVDADSISKKDVETSEICGSPKNSVMSNGTGNQSSHSTEKWHKNSSHQERAAAFVKEFATLINIYFSDEMNPYRSHIENQLKPYYVVEILDKSDACIETENNEVEKVSQGTMKTDEEVEKLKELVCFLTEDKKKLQERIGVMENERNSALTSAERNQMEFEKEFVNLKKECLDLKLTLDNQKSEFEDKQLMLEKTNERLSLQLQISEKIISDQKLEISKALLLQESMTSKVNNLEVAANKLKNDKKLIAMSVDKLMNDVKTLETEKQQVLERAMVDEKLLLQLKRSDHVRKIETKVAEAALRVKQLQDGIKLIPKTINPVLIKNLELLMNQIKEYGLKLHEVCKNFMLQIDEQINQVNNGIPLNELSPVKVVELSKVPSWDNLGLTAQCPCWTTQVQIISAAYSTPTPNTSANYSAPNLPVKSETVNSQMRQPNPIQKPQVLKPVSNENANPGIVLADCKLAPSVQNLFKACSQSALQPQVTNAKPKQVETVVETKPVPNVTNSEDSSASVSATSSVAGKLEKSVASSSLELGYATQVEPKKYVSAAVSHENLHREPKGCYEKLLQKLLLKFPEYKQAQLIDFVKQLRDQRNGKLSGLTMDSIINQVSLLIESKKAKRVMAPPEEVIRSRPTASLVNKKIVLNETKVKKTPVENNAQKKCPWGIGDGDSSKQWSGNDIEDDCSICCEDMTKNPYRVDCGHFFHFKCIKEWLSKKSDCPICRVHLLLPDDYPALK